MTLIHILERVECHDDIIIKRAGEIDIQRPVHCNGPTFDMNVSQGDVSINAQAGTIRVGSESVDQPIHIGVAGQRHIRIGNEEDDTMVQLDAGSTNGVMITTPGTFSVRANADNEPLLTVDGQTGHTQIQGDVLMNDTHVKHLADPVDAQDASNKRWVQATIRSSTLKEPVHVASTAALDVALTSTNTLTGVEPGALEMDGETVPLHSRVLIKNQNNLDQNGIYVVEETGSELEPFVLIRAPDFDSEENMHPGSTVRVLAGQTQNGNLFSCLVTAPLVSIIWQQVAEITVGDAMEIDNHHIRLNLPSGILIGNGTEPVSAVSAPTGTVVGTSDEQTITNKVLQDFTLGSGGTLAHDLNADGYQIVHVKDPLSAQDVATKGYVDSVAAGLQVKASVRATTTSALPDYTFADNTITASSNGTLVVDDVTVEENDRILLKNESAERAPYNGIYRVVQPGSATTPFQLERAADADGSPEHEVVAGVYCFTNEGTSNQAQGYVLVTNNPIQLNVTSLVFVAFSSQSIYVGAGLVKVGATISMEHTPAASAYVGVHDAQTLTNKTLQNYALDAGQLVADMNANDFIITHLAHPTDGHHATNKLYVDTQNQIHTLKEPVRAASTMNLDVVQTQQTLTATNTSALVLDDITLQSGDRVLLKDQQDTSQNGLFTVTNPGGATEEFVLTRSVDFNSTASMLSLCLVTVLSGSTQQSKQYVSSVESPFGAQTWTEIGAIEVGDGMSVANRNISLTTVPIAHGGTGTNSLPQGFLVGNETSAIDAVTIIPISSGGTGTGSLPQGFLVGNDTSAIEAVTTIPISSGGTGATSLPAGYVLSDGSNALTTVTTIPIASGGTGVDKLPSGFLIGNETSAIDAVTIIPISSGGTGTGSLPQGFLVGNDTSAIEAVTTIPISSGGTGATSLPAGYVLSDGSNALTTVTTIPIASGGTGVDKLPSGFLIGNETSAIDAVTIIPITSGGTGTGSLPQGFLVGNGEEPIGHVTTIPISSGGTGTGSLPEGFLVGNGTSAIDAVTTIPISSGGTGIGSLPQGFLVGNGTSAIDAVTTIPISSGGTGTGSLPQGFLVGNGTSAIDAVTTIPISSGGTGLATLPPGILIGDGVNAITAKTAPSGDIVGTTGAQTLADKTLQGVQSFSSSAALKTMVGGTADGSGHIELCTAAGMTRFEIGLASVQQGDGGSDFRLWRHINTGGRFGNPSLEISGETGVITVNESIKTVQPIKMNSVLESHVGTHAEGSVCLMMYNGGNARVGLGLYGEDNSDGPHSGSAFQIWKYQDRPPGDTSGIFAVLSIPRNRNEIDFMGQTLVNFSMNPQMNTMNTMVAASESVSKEMYSHVGSTLTCWGTTSTLLGNTFEDITFPLAFQCETGSDGDECVGISIQLTPLQPSPGFNSTAYVSQVTNESFRVNMGSSSGSSKYYWLAIGFRDTHTF